MKKIQHRGHCQCCGHEQAIMRGFMSKHGYRVKDGWFQGVCHGDNYEPIEVKRDQADRSVASVRAEVVELIQRAADYKAGKIVPKLANSYERDEKGRNVMVPYAEAHAWHQVDAVKSAIWQAESRARAGARWADDMELIVNLYHGWPIKVVELEAGQAPIASGERRQSGSAVLVAEYADRGRVHWFKVKDDKKFRGKMGVQSWRLLPIAA